MTLLKSGKDERYGSISIVLRIFTRKENNVTAQLLLTSADTFVEHEIDMNTFYNSNVV